MKTTLRTAVAAIMLCCCMAVQAQDTKLDFRFMSPPDKPYAATLDFRCLGGINCEAPNADASKLCFDFITPAPKANSALPVVLAYRDAALPCVYCEVMDRQKHELPVAIKWVTGPDIPAWVSAYPTLHWQASDGTWRMCEGWPGTVEFMRLYRSTVAPSYLTQPSGSSPRRGGARG